MKDTTLLAFQRVAELKSLSAAAKELYISTPSLKQCMDGLEKEVGFPVLNRTNKGVTLTKEGKMLYDGSKKILTDYQKLLHKCQKSYRDTRKTLKIGIAMPSALSAICDAFSHAYPDIPLQFLTLEGTRPNDMLEMLEDGRVDLLEFMDMGLHSEKDVRFVPVLIDHLCALVSSKNPLSKEREIDLCNISGQTIYISDADTASVPVLSSLFQGEQKDVALKTTKYTDTEIINACTGSSFYLSEFFYAQKFVTLNLIPLKQKITFDIGIAYRNEDSPLIEKFISFCEF